MSVSTIFEDEYILCVSKPNNVVVHHAKFSKNVIEEKSLLQLVKDEYNLDCYPIHRLDRKTSGIILLAKKKEYVNAFQQLFTNNEISKTYFGLVRGFSPDEKVIDSPVKGRDEKVYKDAETHLKTLANITLNIPVTPYDSSRYSLVELTPKTGRTHQLRLHTRKISHPLLCDPKYGDNNHNHMFVEQFGWENLFLHAGFLTFKHPFSNKELNLSADFPEHWLSAFKEFKWENPIEK